MKINLICKKSNNHIKIIEGIRCNNVSKLIENLKIEKGYKEVKVFK